MIRNSQKSDFADGGKAFVLHTFKFQLSDKSPIHSLLSLLALIDLHVGINDLTPDNT